MRDADDEKPAAMTPGTPLGRRMRSDRPRPGTGRGRVLPVVSRPRRAHATIGPPKPGDRVVVARIRNDACTGHGKRATVAARAVVIARRSVRKIGNRASEAHDMAPSRDSLIKIFSYYRDAEMRGAALLMKMMNRISDPKAQVLFSRHIDDETRHAWLWTKRITDEGGLPVPVPDGYQRRLGKALGIPGNIIDLFALTVIVEERSQKRYAAHASSPVCDDRTRDVLQALTKDEKWHVAWMEDYLMAMAREQAREDRVRETLDRYRMIEEQVFEEMREMEREWIGFSFSDRQAARP